MEYPIPNPSGNKMLSLVNELYQRSTGMCRAGAGPYGIGVSVVEDTPIDVFFTFDPDPVLDCKILPEEIPEYTVGVIGSWRTQISFAGGGGAASLCLGPEDQNIGGNAPVL